VIEDYNQDNVSVGGDSEAAHAKGKGTPSLIDGKSREGCYRCSWKK